MGWLMGVGKVLLSHWESWHHKILNFFLEIACFCTFRLLFKVHSACNSGVGKSYCKDDLAATACKEVAS